MPTTEPPIICPSKARGESKEGTPRGIKEALFSKAGDAKKETETINFNFKRTKVATATVSVWKAEKIFLDVNHLKKLFLP